jgi:hypothetical protein
MKGLSWIKPADLYKPLPDLSKNEPDETTYGSLA